MDASLLPSLRPRCKHLRAELVIEPATYRSFAALVAGSNQSSSQIKSPSFEGLFIWLGKWFLFQTFEELDSVKDKEPDVKEIHELLDDFGRLSQ